MRAPIFEYPSFFYKVEDWEFKKKGLLKRLDKQKFVRTELQTFETDRQTAGKSYVHHLAELLRPELSVFCEEAAVTCAMTDAWCIRYYKGDYQGPHNHRSWGFSGVLYVENDPEVHPPTTFIAPWNDPRTDRSLLAYPPSMEEGFLFIVPSYTLHYVPPNTSRKRRTIVSFDLLPEQPTQTLNDVQN